MYPSRGIEASLADACDLLIGSSNEISDDSSLVSLLCALATELPVVKKNALKVAVSIEAVLVSNAARIAATAGRKEAPADANAPQFFYVVSVHPEELGAALKRSVDALISLSRDTETIHHPLVSVAWVDRRIVEQHCVAARAATAPFVVVAAHATALEEQLSAKRHVNRKRPHAFDTGAASTDSVQTPSEDDDACLVLYLPAGHQHADLHEALASSAAIDELLADLQRVVTERSLPVTKHFFQETSRGRRFFMRLATDLDASRTRDLLINLAKREAVKSFRLITPATLKCCSVSDMNTAMQQNAFNDELHLVET